MNDLFNQEIVITIINQFADLPYEDNYVFCCAIEHHINQVLKLNIDYRKIHKLVSEYLSGE